MTQRSTRIRWNAEERSTLLAAYQQLRRQDPKAGVAERFAAAQKALPRERRRALDYQLRGWLEGASKGVGAPRRVAAANAVATVAPGRKKRGKGAPPPPVTMASKAPAAPALESAPPPSERAAQSLPLNSAAIAEVLVELGSEIVAEILESARVQQALRALLRAAWPTAAPEAPVPAPIPPADAAPPEPGAVPAAVPANGKLRVLIAGIEQRDGAVLAKTYDDTLELVCWSAADGPDRLPEAVARADVVVGMTGSLSQPVEQTLRRHAKRYLRNARGVAGLRSELAGLALSGDAAGGG